MHRREIWARPHPHISAHSPTLLCWMHNICNEIMFPVGMVVAGGWRCAVNINAASPRLSGSIGVMVGGKWIYGSMRSFILLPKATAKRPCRWVLILSLWTPRSDVRRVLFCHMSSWVLNERHGQFNLKSPCNWPTALLRFRMMARLWWFGDGWSFYSSWINGGTSGPYPKSCMSSLKHSFSGNSQKNAMVRQAAFHLLHLTLTNSSELICSTSSV